MHACDTSWMNNYEFKWPSIFVAYLDLRLSCAYSHQLIVHARYFENHLCHLIPILWTDIDWKDRTIEIYTWNTYIQFSRYNFTIMHILKKSLNFVVGMHKFPVASSLYVVLLQLFQVRECRRLQTSSVCVCPKLGACKHGKSEDVFCCCISYLIFFHYCENKSGRYFSRLNC